MAWRPAQRRLGRGSAGIHAERERFSLYPIDLAWFASRVIEPGGRWHEEQESLPQEGRRGGKIPGRQARLDAVPVTLAKSAMPIGAHVAEDH